MMESDSQFPSDPDKGRFPEADSNSDQQTGSSSADNKPKLQLKQILTPLYQQPKPVKKKDDADLQDEFLKPKLVIPKAVPIEPEPELAPHEKEALAAIPVEGPAAVELGPDGQPIKPPDAEEASEQMDPDTPEQTEPDEPESEIEELVTSAPPERKKGIKLMAIGLPVVLILILALVHFLFDPLGLKIEPIKPLDKVAIPGSDTLDTAAIEVDTKQQVVDIDLELMTVDSYVEYLKGRNILITENPEGIIVDSVMFPIGTSLNPSLGISLQEVELDNRKPVIRLADSTGKIFELSLR